MSFISDKEFIARKNDYLADAFGQTHQFRSYKSGSEVAFFNLGDNCAGTPVAQINLPPAIFKGDIAPLERYIVAMSGINSKHIKLDQNTVHLVAVTCESSYFCPNHYSGIPFYNRSNISAEDIQADMVKRETLSKWINGLSAYLTNNFPLGRETTTLALTSGNCEGLVSVIDHPESPYVHADMVQAGGDVKKILKQDGILTISHALNACEVIQDEKMNLFVDMALEKINTLESYSKNNILIFKKMVPTPEAIQTIRRIAETSLKQSNKKPEIRDLMANKGFSL